MEAICFSITTPLEFGAADFAEIRLEPRPFPKDKAERDTYQYLFKLMQAFPDPRGFTKAELEKYCRERFGVTVEGFEKYCWPEANKRAIGSGARWNKPGRRPRR